MAIGRTCPEPIIEIQRVSSVLYTFIQVDFLSFSFWSAVHYVMPQSDPVLPPLITFDFVTSYQVLPLQKESKLPPGYISCSVSCLKLILPAIIATAELPDFLSGGSSTSHMF